MKWKRGWMLLLVCALLTLAPGPGRLSAVEGAVNIFASPVQAGCYMAKQNQCKIHVEPFTISLSTAKKLVFFQLVTVRAGLGTQQVIYDFRPDLSNPVPFSGNTFTPSLVAKDYAATCGRSYSLSLQGQDTGDTTPFSLGLTGAFKCPTGAYRIQLPIIKK